MLDADKLSQALKLGAKSPDFTNLVAWFAEQLATFIDIDETVHATTSPDDASSFLLELSFFLKEIGCVNEKLMTGNINQRLANESERAILIEFLVTELMACKICEIKCPKEEKQMEVTIVSISKQIISNNSCRITICIMYNNLNIAKNIFNYSLFTG